MIYIYYVYDNNSVIINKSDIIPTDINNYGILNEDLDLIGYYEYIVGAVDNNHNITYYTRKVKPVDYLAYKIENANQDISSLQIATNTNPIDISTLNGAIQSKLRDLSNECQSTIYAGIDIEDSVGIEHFDMTENDQINISSQYSAVLAGATEVPYHAKGTLCRMFTADEIQTIYKQAKYCVAYNTTLYNHLSIWVKRCTTIDDVNAITYTSTLPDDLKTNFDTIVSTLGSV